MSTTSIPKSLLGPNGHLKRGVVVFYEGASLVPDLVIRLGTGTFWTHCGVSDGNGFVYNACFEGGTCRSPELQECDSAYAMYPGNVETLCLTLESALGLGYDLLGCVCSPLWTSEFLRKFVWNPDCQDAKSFFCSSYLAYAMRFDKTLPTQYRPAPWKPTHTIIPQDIYNAMSRLIVT